MALGSAAGRNAPFGDARYLGGSAGGAKLSPQSFITSLLVSDVMGVTVHARRAAEIAIVPKRSRTWFGRRRPLAAQRLPRMLPEEPNYAKVRETLVARSRLVATEAAKRQRSG